MKVATNNYIQKRFWVKFDDNLATHENTSKNKKMLFIIYLMLSFNLI